MSEEQNSSVKLFSYNDDLPNEVKGSLIPKSVRTKRSRFAPPAGLVKVSLSVLGLFALAVVGASGYGLLSNMTLVAAPVVTIIDPYTQTETTLEYGPQISLSKYGLFTETLDAFVEEGMTFVEIDANKNLLRFFKNGVLLQSTEVLGLPDEESWWSIPSGLYKIEGKSEREFNSSGQVYLPWLITFQGNLMIHGTPEYPDGEKAEEDFRAGGVRLSDEAAEILFDHVAVGQPVLVHEKQPEERDDFVYAPQAPEVGANHYFVADLDNGTILVSSDVNEMAPVASLVKLMTAVVASEELSLDSRVRVASPTFVTSLIPRLSERSTVSMYSLLQLLLVESSNEAAETIAGELGRHEFIEAMNAKARQLGLMNTHFTDPAGLNADNVSSVGDLYRLVQYIYKDKRFIFDITAKEDLGSVYVGNEFEGLVNFNEIDGVDSFIGGKVGETEAAGQTSISLHRVDIQGEERILVVILLGSEGRSADVELLLEHVKSRFDS